MGDPATYAGRRRFWKVKMVNWVRSVNASEESDSVAGRCLTGESKETKNVQISLR